MGRLIDADFILNKMEKTKEQPVTYSECYAWDFAKALLNNAPTIEAITKADYENRLKADMVAILTEIQSEIEKLSTPPEYQDEDYFLFGAQKCSEIIQKKINALKEESEDK